MSRSRQKLKATRPPHPQVVLGGYPVKPLSPDPKWHRWAHRLVFWDVETNEREDGVHVFALAYGRLYLRQPDLSYEWADQALVGSPAAWWDVVHGWTRAKQTMRLYAANHAFDLGASAWYEHLWSRLGYTADLGKDLFWVASADAPYLSLKGPRGRGRVTFVDTSTLHIGSPAQLGRDLDMPRRPGLEEQEARCRWDVEALAGGTLRYLDRLRGLSVRGTDPTGTGAGFAVYRTLFLQPGSVIHHTDEALYEAEQASRYGGRREAWLHGRIEEPLEEWDYEHAHLNICLDDLPARAGAGSAGRSGVLTLQEWIVETDVPCVPYRDPQRGLVYPVGRFPATLWDDEAALALDAGARLEPGGRLWAYHAEPVMRTWAEWMLQELTTSDDPIWQRVLKSWSHQVVGKWGQSMTVYEPLAPGAPGSNWPAEWNSGAAFAVAHQVGNPDGYGRILHSDMGAVGIKEDAAPADHANYAIQSYVMAKTRIRLWTAMKAAGLENVVQVNGDGMIVTQAGGRKLRRMGIPGLRVKRAYPLGVEVRNAQGIIDLDPEAPIHKLSGLPRGATRVGPDRWEADVWQQGLLGAPVRRPGVWAYPEGPLGRARRPEGLTGPYRVAR